MRVEPSRGRDVRVGRYAIQGEIATGGMATVHCGRLVGPAGFTRNVAIKRLHPQFAKDPDFVAMFLDEARLASRILHPNVVPILDVVADSGELFLVMEFVPGEALSKLFKRTPEGVPLSIAASIAVGVLEGLHAAHEARGENGEPLSIVHRDVSPQNILLGLDGVARLIDFGVAKASGNATATRDGQIKGKVAYMAPEQIRAEPVDRRADVYAASVVLWEMLTGKRYFSEADSDAARMMRALTTEAPPPSTERPELGPEVDAILVRGLQRDPAKRFASAREMAQAIERVTSPAAARDVARWVEAKAGETLALRTQRMNEFDISVATELPGRPSPEVLRESTEISSVQPREVEPPSVVTKPAPKSADQPEPVAGRSRTMPLVVLAACAAGGIGFYAARLVPSKDEAPSTRNAAVASEQPQPERTPASAMTAPAVASVVFASAEPVASSVPMSEPSAIPAPASSPVTARPPLVGHATPARRDAPSTAAKQPKAGCSPNYTITADGVKKYKPECLK
ncbi:MAG: protein kinase [Polyangiaceae bacterium]|nr:protein kinase [Polyangiaceae bacterium]